MLCEPGDKLPMFIKLMKKDDVEYILDEIKVAKTINKTQVSSSLVKSQVFQVLLIPKLLDLFKKCFR